MSYLAVMTRPPNLPLVDTMEARLTYGGSTVQHPVLGVLTSNQEKLEDFVSRLEAADDRRPYIAANYGFFPKLVESVGKFSFSPAELESVWIRVVTLGLPRHESAISIVAAYLGSNLAKHDKLWNGFPSVVYGHSINYLASHDSPWKGVPVTFDGFPEAMQSLPNGDYARLLAEFNEVTVGFEQFDLAYRTGMRKREEGLELADEEIAALSVSQVRAAILMQVVENFRAARTIVTLAGSIIARKGMKKDSNPSKLISG